MGTIRAVSQRLDSSLNTKPFTGWTKKKQQPKTARRFTNAPGTQLRIGLHHKMNKLHSSHPQHKCTLNSNLKDYSRDVSLCSLFRWIVKLWCIIGVLHKSIHHHFVPIFHLSYQLALLKIQLLYIKTESSHLAQANRPLSCKTQQSLHLIEELSKSSKELQQSTETHSSFNIHHAFRLNPLQLFFFCLYRSLTATKYAPCTPFGTIPPLHTSLRRGPGSEVTCWADRRLELLSAAKEVWQTWWTHWSRRNWRRWQRQSKTVWLPPECALVCFTECLPLPKSSQIFPLSLHTSLCFLLGTHFLTFLCLTDSYKLGTLTLQYFQFVLNLIQCDKDCVA